MTANVIFHTGKSRWVVSQELGDGSSCYAFLQDDGNSTMPVNLGDWMVCDERSGQWRPDRSLRVESSAAKATPFGRLRMDVEKEMQDVRIWEDADRQVMWQRIDTNGNGTADLAEVTRLVKDLCKAGVWPAWLDDDLALQRAFKQTLVDDVYGDDEVRQRDFHNLLLNIFWFGKLHEVFQSVDTEDDVMLNFDEFKRGILQLVPGYSEADIKNDFDIGFKKNEHGCVDFEEFCMFIRKKVLGEVTSDGQTTHDKAKIECHEKVALQSGRGGHSAPTNGIMIKKKAWADFDALEAKIQKLATDPSNTGLKKLWRALDYNGNNKVSLAEVDKWVVEQYPLLNHKPALMRAQQATLAAGGNKDFVEKKDFKALLVNLFYYNKLFWIFDQADEGRDRRIDFKEFQFMMNMCGIKLSPSKAQREFASVDTNGGGQVLFDEFCRYFVEKKCPAELMNFVDNE